MEIILFNKNRGLTSLYDGKRYIIHSSCYGVVAVSEPIDRHYPDGKEPSVDIHFRICEWFGYWSLADAICRGVRRLERRFEPNKQVNITFEQQAGQQDYLRLRLCMTLEPTDV